MKKIITLLITTALLCTSLLVSAENIVYSDISKDDICYNHVSRLHDFGLVSGYGDGTFQPDNNITRAEASKLLCMAYNEKDGAKGELEYTDVHKNHWAHNYILTALDLNFMTGYDDNTFRPEQNITAEEFIKTAVCLIGYEGYAEQEGGYPIGYIKTATQLGLTNGIPSLITTDPITRRDTSIILDNMLDVPLNAVAGYTLNEQGSFEVVYEIRDGKGEDYQTLLTWRHNIYTVTGTIKEDNGVPDEDKKPVEEEAKEYITYDGGKVADMEFENKKLATYPLFSTIPTIYTYDEINNIVPLGDKDNTITVNVSGEYTGTLYVALYDINEDKHITSYNGVVLKSNEHKFTGLNGGHNYRVRLSCTDKYQVVSGKITVSAE